MKPFGTSGAIIVSPGGLRHSLLVGILTLGVLGGAAPLGAQEQDAPAGGSTAEFAESAGGGGAPTFRSEPQPVTVKKAMGAVLVTAEDFRLRTALTSRLAECQSTRPDLPEARIQPDEIADRVGTLNLAVFDQKQVNFTFRTTTHGTEYALTVDGSKPNAVQVSLSPSGALVLSATGAPMSVIRDKAETFSCPGAAAFTIRIEP